MEMNYILDTTKLNSIKAEYFLVPMYRRTSFLIARVVFYPKSIGLFNDFRLATFYNDLIHDSKKKDVKFTNVKLSGPYLLSQKPRSRGVLKWIPMGGTNIDKSDLIIPWFRIGGPISGDTHSVISLNSQKRFQVNVSKCLSLNKYEHSHSDYLVYRASFEWFKNNSPNFAGLKKYTRNEINENMWTQKAFNEVNYK